MNDRVWWTIVGLSLATLESACADEVSFSREIQPILARACFACHGPDEGDRQAELRLDLRETAIDYGAIVPGSPDESELIRRIFSDAPDEQMPPPDAHVQLTDEQKEQLRAWVAAGAEYAPHWAFVPPTRLAPPEVGNITPEGWPANPIDNFALARMHEENLSPSGEADRYALVRRVYLDLIGLPPTPEEADAFVHDDSPHAYGNLVDQLLDSPHYGERWARLWLDLGRYSDTNGYEKDRPRSIWPYRDWVIDAINDDLPFDRFTIEQLAGDMLPEATLDQRVATGFHRNTMLNEEGGIDPLEFRYYAMVDRVATTGTVWLGLTTGCAQCHSHKYDPISHTEYYRLMALLDNADEPDLILPDEVIAAQRQEIEAQIATLEAELPSQFPPPDGDGPVAERRARHFEQRFRDWLGEQQLAAVEWTPLRPTSMTTNLPKLELLDDLSILSTGDITKRDLFTLTFALDQFEAPVTALRLEALPDDRLPARGPGRSYYEGRQGDFFLSEVTAHHRTLPTPPASAVDAGSIGNGKSRPTASPGRLLAFNNASHSYGKISVGSGTADAKNVVDGEGSTGWSTAEREGEPHQLVVNLETPVEPEGELQLELLFERHFAASLGRFRISATTAQGDVQASVLSDELLQVLMRPRKSWTNDEVAALQREFSLVSPELVEARKPIDKLRKALPNFPTTLVLQERPADNPRPTHRRHRGEYLNVEEEVAPGIPAFLEAFTQDAPQDRLDFARWLASEANPLVARVVVNRHWRALFGRGLVESVADFGSQSEPPTHPELLDWLACEFIEQGWSRKKLHKLIVTSRVYRQSSAVTPELLAVDPENRVLARGPGHRVDGEIVRDILLKASGLLNPKLGGPSVYPPQPASVTALAYGNSAWKASDGPDRYRRSLYTFSKRTAPFAAYQVFDAPSGETCTARRDRSNTPLQALTLLNDEMYLEMSRALAADVCETISDQTRVDERASAIFRRLLTRPPAEMELRAITDFYRRQHARIDAGEVDTKEITDREDASADLAAWTMTARVLANLDEVIVKP